MEFSLRHLLFMIIIVSIFFRILSSLLDLLAHRVSYKDRVTSRKISKLSSRLRILSLQIFRILNFRNLIILLIFIILAEYAGADIEGMKKFLFESIGAISDIFTLALSAFNAIFRFTIRLFS